MTKFAMKMRIPQHEFDIIMSRKDVQFIYLISVSSRGGNNMYIFYPDVYFFSQFVTSIYVFAITGCIYKVPMRKRRVLWGSALFGVLSTIMVLMVHPFWLYSILLHISVIPATVYMICRPTTGKELIREIATSYVAIWMLYGCVEWITIQTGWSGNLLLCGCSVFVYLVIFLAMQIRRRINNRIPVILCHRGKKLSLTGFCDTGNLLIDPYCNKPVHVINRETLDSFLQETQEKNFRIIPYETVAGKELMESFTVDEMILCKKRPIVLKKEVIGIVKHQILKGDSGQLLLNVSRLNL